jgi:hypothetical protein
MSELQALEHAARYRELARFYSEASKSMRTMRRTTVGSANFAKLPAGSRGGRCSRR